MIRSGFRKRIGMLTLFLLAGGCGAAGTADSAAVTLLPEKEPVLTETPTPIPTETLIPTETPIPTEPPILTAISVEAGEELQAEDFYKETQPEETLTILTELTEEELAAAGAVYEVLVLFGNCEVETVVSIVDTTGPEILGAEDLEMIAGEAISYKKNIVVTDNASGEVTLTVDRDAVDTDTPGEYPVIYTATDAAGNQTSVQIMLTVKEEAAAAKEKLVEELADQLLAELGTAQMSKWDACYTVWNWCRTKIKYAYSAGDRSSIYTGAYEGLHDRSGDCFAYYATFTLLLQKLEIETMAVERVGGTSHHWWNLVNLGDGWYHCDASPRRKGDKFRCFMQTDAQVLAYTESYPEHPNYYVFDESLYPERETTIIYGE